MGDAEDEEITTEDEPISGDVVVVLGNMDEEVCQSGAVCVSEPGGRGFHKTVSSMIDQATMPRNTPE